MAGITETLKLLFVIDDTEFDNKFGKTLASMEVFRQSLSDMTAPLEQMTSNMTDMATEFQLSMANVSTLMGEDTKQLDQFNEQIIEMSKRVPQTAKELADGLYQVVSAGISTSDAMQFLETSSKAAVAGMTDSYTAVDAITSVMNAFGMSAKDATKISDVMFQTVKLGKINFQELANGIGMVAPTAAAAGVSMEQMMAALATGTGKLKPEQAITGLSAAITELNTPAGKAEKALQKLGYENLQAALKTNTLQEVMIKLAQSGTKIDAIFGVEAGRAVKAIGNSAEVARDQLRQMSDSAGMSEEAFKKLNDTYENSQIRLQNITDSIKIQIGQDFMPAMKNINNIQSFFMEQLADAPKAFRLFAGGVLYGGTAVGKLANSTATGVRNVLALRDGYKTFKDILPSVIKFLGLTSTANTTVGATGAGASVGVGTLKKALLALQSSVPLLIGLTVALAAAGFAIDKIFDKVDKNRKKIDDNLSSGIKGDTEALGQLKAAYQNFGTDIGESQLELLRDNERITDEQLKLYKKDKNALKEKLDQYQTSVDLQKKRLSEQSKTQKEANETDVTEDKKTKDKKVKQEHDYNADLQKLREDNLQKENDFRLKSLEGTEEYFEEKEKLAFDEYEKNRLLAIKNIKDEETRFATIAELTRKYNLELAKINKEKQDEIDKVTAENDEKEKERLEKLAEDELKLQEERLEKLKDSAQAKVDLITSISDTIGSSLVNSITDGSKAFKDMLKDILNTLVDFLGKKLLTAYASAALDSILSGGLTLGSNIAKLAVASVAIAGAKAAIAKFDVSGIPTRDGYGIVEKSDVIINPTKDNPVIRSLAEALNRQQTGDQVINMVLDGDRIGTATIKRINKANERLTSGRSVIK